MDPEILVSEYVSTNLLGQLFADFGRTSPAYYRLFTLATGDTGIDPPSREACRELLSRPLDRLAESGRVEPADLAALKQAFWALIHGVVMLQVTRPEYDWEDRLLEVGLKGLIAGTVAAQGTTSDAADGSRSSEGPLEEGA